MPLRRFFERRRRDRAATSLYLSVVEQSRRPAFYARLGVPDTVEARFDMIALHAWMVLRRLGKIGDEGATALSQAVVDLMFADMDRNLREMGVTDLRVGKRVRRMAEAFYGRAAAYDRVLGEGGDALKAALARNIYQAEEARPDQLDGLAAYVLGQLAHLDGQAAGPLLEGTVTFRPMEDA